MHHASVLQSPAIWQLNGIDDREASDLNEKRADRSSFDTKNRGGRFADRLEVSCIRICDLHEEGVDAHLISAAIRYRIFVQLCIQTDVGPFARSFNR